jgi:CRP/FNR family cyclic AMP-dependent transcriptional regulator
VDDTDFLHTLTPAEADALEAMGEPGAYAAGEVIFEQGGTADRVFLLRAGRVRVSAAAGDGEELVLAERGPGELLGELSGIDGGPRSASVTAVDEVHGLVVPLRAFRGFLMDNPRAALSLLELISRRLREAEGRRAS